MSALKHTSTWVLISLGSNQDSVLKIDADVIMECTDQVHAL